MIIRNVFSYTFYIYFLEPLSFQNQYESLIKILKEGNSKNELITVQNKRIE